MHVEPVSDGRSSSRHLESEMSRHPRGRAVEADRYPSPEMRTGMWAGLGAWESWKRLVTVARVNYFHVILKVTYWLFGESPVCC